MNGTYNNFAALAERVDKLEKRIAELTGKPDADTNPAAAVVSMVSDWYGVTTVQIMSKVRTAHVAWPRQVAMFLIREHLCWTTERIGNFFGGKDHSTVLHACKLVRDRSGDEPATGSALLALSEKVKQTIKS